MPHEWRSHPKLRGRLLPTHPDDMQVIVHDGGPRVSNHAPEVVWVTVTGVDGDVFTGQVLNQPTQLETVSQGMSIRFLVPDGGEHALMVTGQYLRERPDWIIEPCNKCGLSELFDPPSVLMRIVFPNMEPDAIVDAFTARCGACGGFQLVRNRNGPPDEDDAENAPTQPKERTGLTPMAPVRPRPKSTRRKKWWQFWR